MDFNHKTVLLKETIESLNINPDGVYIDATAGGGGLSFEIASELSPRGRLVCIDRDPDAIRVCSERFKNFENVTVVQSNFSDIDKIVHNLDLKSVNGVALDLGVSSYQLDAAERGFSYKKDAPLDMRMSKSGKSAFDAVNFLNCEQLQDIIRMYGEEHFALRIARSIIEKREQSPIKNTLELAEIVKSAIPFFARREGGHPARRTFQAIRIYVNDELESLEKGLDNAFGVLSKSGRIAVITFHSLEDRIVKNRMKSWAHGCVCPPDFPICVCGNKPKAKLLKRKATEPSAEEVSSNPRSRSAKLRVCEKLNNANNN